MCHKMAFDMLWVWLRWIFQCHDCLCIRGGRGKKCCTELPNHNSDGSQSGSQKADLHHSNNHFPVKWRGHIFRGVKAILRQENKVIDSNLSFWCYGCICEMQETLMHKNTLLIDALCKHLLLSVCNNTAFWVVQQWLLDGVVKSVLFCFFGTWSGNKIKSGSQHRFLILNLVWVKPLEQVESQVILFAAAHFSNFWTL